ncbi:glycosyltransferase family 4 protein [bacterium]|nr:glycosyltransferase family 4 protein [bacterium]
MSESKSLRVLRVMPLLGSAGTEVQCVEVLDELARPGADYGISPELAVMYRNPVEGARRPAACPVHELGVKRRKHSGIVVAAHKLSGHIPNYDVVHALLWPAVWAVSMARRGDCAFVASIHGSHEQSGPLGLKRAIDRPMMARADALVFNSEAGRSALTPHFGVDPATVSVIPNGKQPYPNPPGDAERNGIVCMARFRRPKRHDLLLAALAQMDSSERPRACFVGYDTRTAEFQKLASGLGLGAEIECLGGVPDPNPYLASALISALPTDHEGMPNAVLESWNTGTAVIASRVPGVQELVRDGIDGLLVDNTPQAWAGGIRRLLEDSALRQQLATEGRRRFEAEFSLQHTAKAWAELYRKVAGK